MPCQGGEKFEIGFWNLVPKGKKSKLNEHSDQI